VPTSGKEPLRISLVCARFLSAHTKYVQRGGPLPHNDTIEQQKKVKNEPVLFVTALQIDLKTLIQRQSVEIPKSLNFGDKTLLNYTHLLVGQCAC
jgi:hypothetical protein